MERKAVLEDRLIGIVEQPSVSFPELKKSLDGLIKLGKGPIAHQLMLIFYGSHLQKKLRRCFPRALSILKHVLLHCLRLFSLLFH